MNTKEKLIEVLKNPANKLIAVDMDGVLCESEFWGGDEPKPKQEVVDYFNGLYVKGAHIIIYTARNPKWYAITQTWLDKHGVMYHGISMMKKIGADIYCDDKALNIEDIIEEFIAF